MPRQRNQSRRLRYWVFETLHHRYVLYTFENDTKKASFEFIWKRSAFDVETVFLFLWIQSFRSPSTTTTSDRTRLWGWRQIDHIRWRSSFGVRSSELAFRNAFFDNICRAFYLFSFRRDRWRERRRGARQVPAFNGCFVFLSEGNSKSLKTDPARNKVDVAKVLRDFFKTYYLAQYMTLCIQSSGKCDHRF